MKKVTFLIFILFLFYINTYCQSDTILLMKGKRIICNNATITRHNGRKVILYMLENGKKRTIKTTNVFSLITQDGIETVFFKPKTKDTTDFNIDQMRWYLNGKADINTWEFKKGIYASGFMVGAAIPFIPKYEVDAFEKQVRVPSGLITEMLVLQGFNSYTPKYEDLVKKYPNIPNNPYYIEGMQEAIKDRNVNIVFIGSVSGYLTGLLVNFAID